MNGGSKKPNVLRNQRGQALPIVGVAFLALVGMTAIAIDVAHQSNVANEVQLLADSVATAAARAATDTTATGGDAEAARTAAESDAQSIAAITTVQGVTATTDCDPSDGPFPCVEVQVGSYSGTTFTADGSPVTAAQVQAYTKTLHLVGIFESAAAIHKTATAAYTSIRSAESNPAVGTPRFLPLALVKGGCAYGNQSDAGACCSPDGSGGFTCPWSIGCRLNSGNLEVAGSGSGPYGSYPAYGGWTALSNVEPTVDAIKALLPVGSGTCGGGGSPLTLTVGQRLQTMANSGDADDVTNRGHVVDALDCTFHDPNSGWVLDVTPLLIPVIDAGICPTDYAIPLATPVSGYPIVGFISVIVTGICPPTLTAHCEGGAGQAIGVSGQFTLNISAPFTAGGTMIHTGYPSTGSAAGADYTVDSSGSGDFGTGYIILVTDHV